MEEEEEDLVSCLPAYLGHEDDDGEVGQGGGEDQPEVGSVVERSEGEADSRSYDGVGAGEDRVEEDHGEGPGRPHLQTVHL